MSYERFAAILLILGITALAVNLVSPTGAKVRDAATLVSSKEVKHD